MSQQRRDGVVFKRISMAALVAGVLSLVACSSTPPPRPLPEPRSQSSTQTSSQRAAIDERAREETPTRTAEADASTPTTPTTPETTPSTPTPTTPDWYREGAFEIDGREHRAFAVTAGDVREARGQAMAMAYQRYPGGEVAAHEAVRLGDGRWRFFVLMAAGG
ncbi:MAG: hypothetical protein RIE32_04975 [Phycisphaerales bacterium]